MLEYYCKHSRETLDYTIDFNRFLVGRESIVSASAVISAPVVITAVSTMIITRAEFTSNQVAVWLYGGENNIQYTITVEITTDQGRRKSESFMVRTVGYSEVLETVNISDATATVKYEN